MAANEYADDSTIEDSANLWRRIPPWHFVFDDNLGRRRRSKAAFDDHPNGSPMSVVLADEVIRSGRTGASLIKTFPGFALASLTAGFVRSRQQGVAREPLDDEPAHAVVFGRKTDSIKKQMAKASQWVVAPVN